MQTTEIFVIQADNAPVRLHLNGISATIPIGKDFPLDERLLPALRDADGVTWRIAGVAGDGDVSGGIAVPVTISPDFDPEALIAGNVEEVAARLAGLTPAELDAVRAAEQDREVSRKGVIAAINRAIEAHNEEAPTDENPA